MASTWGSLAPPVAVDPADPAAAPPAQISPGILELLRQRLGAAASGVGNVLSTGMAPSPALEILRPSPTLQHVSQGMVEAAAYPGEVMQAGMRGEGAPLADMANWGVGTSLGMVGSGTPFARFGAIGATGGRMKQPAPAPAEPAPGIRAYHGSPHDFDAFDISKIGSGEGAQAYGHGLYFAERPGVAESYKAAGQPTYLGADRVSAAKQLLEDAGGDRAAALAAANARMKSTMKYGEGKLWQDVVNNFDDLTGKGQGRMYEVEIKAHPDKFLDWDKPLSKQSPEVQAIVRPQLKAWEERAIKKYGGGRVYLKNMDELTGKDIYERMGAPAINRTKGYPASSDKLGEMGIPGIRYLDQGTRGVPKQAKMAQDVLDAPKPEGMTEEAYQAHRQKWQKTLDELPKQTHNYVVFNDKLIDILKKYGIAGLISAGAYHHQMPAEQ